MTVAANHWRACTKYVRIRGEGDQRFVTSLRNSYGFCVTKGAKNRENWHTYFVHAPLVRCQIEDFPKNPKLK